MSTDQQVERYGLESQRVACQPYATEQHYTLVAEYLEGEGQRGVSGGNTERPVMTRLLQEAKAKPRPFDVVLISDTSRLARDDFMWYGGWAEAQLAEYGIRVEYVTERFSQDPASQLHKQILRGVNTFYKQTTAIHDRAGIVARAKEGKWPGGMPPLGYDVVTERLVINSDEAQLVQQIFHLYTEQHLTVSQIATRLFQAGIPSKWQRLGTKHIIRRPSWSPSGIYRLLENSVYIGQFVWGWKKNPRHQTWLSNEQVIVTCPAIITQEQWEAAQQRMTANRLHGRRDKRHPYLVSGLLHCAVCGWAMRGMPTKRPGLQYYFCNPSERPGHTLCYNRIRFRVQTVDDAVWATLVQGLQDPAQLHTLLQQQLTTDPSDTMARLRSLEEQMTTLERKGAEVLQVDTSTPFAREQVAHLLADLGSQRETLLQEHRRLQATLGIKQASGSGVTQVKQVRRWLLSTPVTAVDEGLSATPLPTPEGTAAAVAAPLSTEQQTWLFRLRQRIVRELVGEVRLRPDGTGALYLQGEARPLPLQVPVLPPKKKAKSS